MVATSATAASNATMSFSAGRTQETQYRRAAAPGPARAANILRPTTFNPPANRPISRRNYRGGQRAIPTFRALNGWNAGLRRHVSFERHSPAPRRVGTRREPLGEFDVIA